MTERIGVCAYTCICLEDVGWVPQYLAEAKRLGLHYGVYMDRCRPEDDVCLEEMAKNHLCVGVTMRSPRRRGLLAEFRETDQQYVLDLVRDYRWGQYHKFGFRWALSWDTDETFERDAAGKLLELGRRNDVCLKLPFVVAWDESSRIRVNSPFSTGEAWKHAAYNLGTGGAWRFVDAAVKGPKLYPRGRRRGPARVEAECFNLMKIHWGYMTEELRRFHKERWDRIYGAVVGKNPYGLWDFLLDPAYPAETAENPYL